MDGKLIGYSINFNVVADRLFVVITHTCAIHKRIDTRSVEMTAFGRILNFYQRNIRMLRITPHLSKGNQLRIHPNTGRITSSCYNCIFDLPLYVFSDTYILSMTGRRKKKNSDIEWLLITISFPNTWMFAPKVFLL